MNPEPPEQGGSSRRRVTVARSAILASGARRRTEPGSSTSGIDTLDLQTLIKTQLRLGIICCLALVVVMSGAAVAISTAPLLHQTHVFGVPWSWVLQAYGMYPLILAFAAVYARIARRNESRYRSLLEGA